MGLAKENKGALDKISDLPDFDLFFRFTVGSLLNFIKLVQSTRATCSSPSKQNPIVTPPTEPSPITFVKERNLYFVQFIKSKVTYFEFG